MDVNRSGKTRRGMTARTLFRSRRRSGQVWSDSSLWFVTVCVPFDRGKAEGSVLYAGNLRNASGLKFYKIVCENRNSSTAFACGGIEVVHFRKVSLK